MVEELSPSDLARRLAQLPRKPRAVMERVCAFCGKTFETRWAKSQYCSGNCRQKAFALRKKKAAALGVEPSALMEDRGGE